jgi:nucleotide-binding universal stress UspA family protein
MFKDVLVNLSVADRRDPVCDYAVSLANAFNAHLSGIAFAYDPAVPAIAGGCEVMLPGWIEEERGKATERAKAAVAKFEAAARREGLSADSRVLDATARKAPHLFAQIARRFDLSLVQQSDPEQPGHENVITTAAIFDSGRPVLIVPYIQTDGLRLNRVMICWDGSRNAARAIADAQPFLTRAKAVELVTVVSADIKSDEMGDADITRHLARHYPKVEVENITAADLDVPDAILSHAADTSADFIVMGGYGHSRLREFILGGATRGMLATMTIPTLMSH